MIKCLELDSHADTCLFGKDALLLQLSDEQVQVSGFHPSLQTLENIPIASVAMAYDDPVTFETWMLEFHQVLYSRDLPHGLLCPNQMRDNGVTVNDVPRQFAADKRNPCTHAIITNRVTIPLELKGVWSAFPFRTPTMDEWRDSTNRIEMTSPSVKWDPHSTYFEEREREYEPILSVADRFASSISWINFNKLDKKRKREAAATLTRKRKGVIGPKELARQWCLTADMAERTIESTQFYACDRDETTALNG